MDWYEAEVDFYPDRPPLAELRGRPCRLSTLRTLRTVLVSGGAVSACR
jgi:hypothetical protein